MMTKRWQDPVNMLLGLWLFVSPWALQYAVNEVAAWNAYVLGVAVVLFAAVAMYMPKVWEEMVNLLLGVWMIVAPFVLRFSSETTTTANAVIVGALIIAFAIWAMFNDAQFNKWWHEHRFF